MRQFMVFTSDAEVVRIGTGLIDRTLPKAEWTHAAHFAAVIWLLACRPELDCEAVLPGFIRAYNEATGVANTASGGYHETITLASLRAARAFFDMRRGRPVYLICNELMETGLGDPDWLLEYWSREVLFSPAARLGWVPPDRVPEPDSSPHPL